MSKLLPLISLLAFISVSNGQNLPFNPNYKPFYHGVASGDPLEDRVIIWTRITPEQDQTINGTYIVAQDTALKNIVKTGTFSTDINKDYTVKIDVTGLQPNSTYYYTFNALGRRSAIGRTKTTPSVSSANLTDNLKFAVVVCSNYEGGYFNAYGTLANRNDLNAVIHLGDYIYEYQTGGYTNANLKDSLRKNIPTTELLTKADYRTRYSLYRLDENLQRAHQQHPFITVWDDHEVANDAYVTGAQNHQANEGDWETRKRIAREAYFEWLPIRDINANAPIYRAFSYGKLMDLYMLDTRMEGRQMQPLTFDAPDDSLNPRRIMSQTQFQWLVNNLKNSQARWKVVGNQVIFSNTNVGFAASNPKSYTEISNFENLFRDSWEGYSLQRNRLIDSFQHNNINNIVFVTGDSHASWAFDITKKPVLYPEAQFNYIPQPNPYSTTTKQGYNPETGEGSQGVEFCTPSISAANFDEILSTQIAGYFESIINKPVPNIEGKPNYNPHLKFVDLDRHGYMVLDIRADSVQTDFFYTPSVIAVHNTENWGGGVSSRYNSNRITTALTEKSAPTKPVQDIPAPKFNVISSLKKEGFAPVIFSISPNPTSQFLNLQYGLNENTDITINLIDIEGRIVKTIANYKNQSVGIHHLFNIDVSHLSKGLYFVQINAGNTLTLRKVMIH